MLPKPHLSRRRFLRRAATGAGSSFLAGAPLATRAIPPFTRPAGGPFKLSLAAYSYRSYLDLRLSPRPMDIFAFVRACDDTQDRGGIGGTAGKRSDMVQRVRECEATIATDPSPGWLDARDIVAGGRKPNRSAGVGGQRTECHACRCRDT